MGARPVRGSKIYIPTMLFKSVSQVQVIEKGCTDQNDDADSPRDVKVIDEDR